MLGERIRSARRLRRMTQADLGAAADTTGGHISKVETGKSGLLWEMLASVALALGVSSDWLIGITDSSVPADDRAVDQCLMGFVPVHRLVTIAGVTKGTVYTTDSGVIPFRRSWLDQNEMDPKAANVFRVHGDSMAPTLTDGAAILVDYKRNHLREGGIFVFKHGESLLVKRAHFDGSWWFVSDNPEYDPIVLREDAYIFGEVRWTGRAF